MEKHSTGVVTCPLAAAGLTPTRNLLNLLYRPSSKTYLVTSGDGCELASEGSGIKIVPYAHKNADGPVARAANYIHTQLSIAEKIFRLRDEVDTWVFFIGGDTLLLPIITSRILGKRAMVLFAGSTSQALRSNNDALYVPLSILSRASTLIASDLVIYSDRFIKNYHLGRFKDKVKIESEHHLNFDLFTCKNSIYSRPNKVAFIGRLGHEKGVLNFLEAIPKVGHDNVEFVIYGDGELRGEVERIAKKLQPLIKICVKGWAEREDLPRILNDIRLIVIPSYTEGLPNIMLESMACGAPVLANRVGMIEDIIIDGETGYLINDNDASTIASGITAALSDPRLGEVSEAAEKLVRQKYSFDKKRKAWEQLMSSADKGHSSGNFREGQSYRP